MRDDLKLAAYAVALGYTLSTDRQPHGSTLNPADFAYKGVPGDGLQFERNGVSVWNTARGWRIAKLINDRFTKPEAGDFRRDLFTALNDGVSLGDDPTIERA